MTTVLRHHELHDGRAAAPGARARSEGSERIGVATRARAAVAPGAAPLEQPIAGRRARAGATSPSARPEEIT